MKLSDYDTMNVRFAKKLNLSTEFIYFRINPLKTSLRPDYSHKIFNDARTGYVFLVNALAEDSMH